MVILFLPLMKIVYRNSKLIVSKQPQNSLFNQESFKQLSERITPNLATVWLNQEKTKLGLLFPTILADERC